MGNDIKVGMSFGNYNDMTKELAAKYTETKSDDAYQKGYESESLFTDKGRVTANAYRENMKINRNGHLGFSDAVIFNGKLQYGTSSNSFEKLNVFDYIQSAKQHAIDINGNGIVDKDEIFEGELDRQAYKKAKNEGDISKYDSIRKEYKYDWLK